MQQADAGFYSRVGYWDDRYASEAPGTTDEWIFSFEGLKDLLPLKAARTVVDVGCGVSSLLSEIRDSGFTGKLVGLDFSEAGITKARSLFGDKKIEYIQGDAKNLSNFVDSVDLIIDKTAIDSILCAGASGRATVTQYCQEVGKILCEDGAFVWCSFQSLQPYGQEILDGIIVPGLTATNDYHGLGWTLDIHTWDNYASNRNLNPTIYIFRKVHRSPRFLGDDVSSIETSMHYY